MTGDYSRNNLWLALLTFGEGWHNNHHHYQSAARQGFQWYEIDVSYYLLKALAAARLVWDLRSPPSSVVRSEQRLRRVVVERAAGQLAASFQVEQITAQLRALLAEKRASLSTSIDELHDELTGLLDSWSHQFDDRLEAVRQELDEFIRTAQLSALPTVIDLRSRAAELFVDTPSMNDIVERARQILIDDVLEQLLGREMALAPVKA